MLKAKRATFRVREHHAPDRCIETGSAPAICFVLESQGAPLTCGSSPPTGLACQRWTSSESCRTWRPEVSASSSLTPPTLSATTSQGEFMLIILAAAAQLERSMIVKPRGSPWPRCVASTRSGPSSRSSRSRRFVADGVVPKAVVARDLETDPVHDSSGRRSLRA